MPRDKKGKKNKLPFTTDLSEHCKSEADCFANQFIKFFFHLTESLNVQQ